MHRVFFLLWQLTTHLFDAISLGHLIGLVKCFKSPSTGNQQLTPICLEFAIGTMWGNYMELCGMRFSTLWPKGFVLFKKTSSGV